MFSADGQRTPERWVTGHHHNQSQLSGIFPNEIWMKIVLEADNATVWSLRNACRFFLGLCEITTVARDRRIAWRPDKMILPQQTAWWGIDAHGVKDMLSTAHFCMPCRQWREFVLPGDVLRLKDQMSSWVHPLHGGLPCSGCAVQHPDILYTALEREKISSPAVDGKTATCVGRQASIPICEHVSITMDELEQFMNSVKTKEREDYVSHQHHLVCYHDSHKAIYRPDTVPRATLSYLNSCIEIQIQWEAAIVTLPVDDTTGEPLKVSYSQLQMLISAAVKQRGGGAPRLLCPHLEWEDQSLLRPFDPVYCCCLGEDIPVLHDAERCESRGLVHDCCLCRSHRYNTAGKLLPYTSEGIGGTQLASHKATCTDCGTWYSWTRRKHTVTGEQMLWLDMECVVSLASAMNPCDINWLSRIDPASVPGQWDRDPGLKHLIWCDDPKCATSYRGRARTRVLRQIWEC